MERLGIEYFAIGRGRAVPARGLVGGRAALNVENL
jgi:hypothetical protein